MALNNGDRSEIKLMISEAIKEYDKVQIQRHEQNLKKFDEIMNTVRQVRDVRGLIAWGVPLIISILLLITEYLRTK